ncbi:MAG: energy-coupling factor transporter ATPase [Clostridiales bacterium]|nr:MAG: energy-coupling factor transporter ATPase [Clostridiales bacterium]
MSLIRTENLTHIYGQSTPFEKAAIKDINIEINEGDFIGVIGHTGSGKSTFIQHLNGLLKPTSGTIYFNEEDIWQKKYSRHALRFEVGLVFQYPEYQLFEETVEKDIGFGPKNMGLSETEIKERVLWAISVVGLHESILSSSPFDLSGGQKRRVAIAGILAMKPKVLILDEPTAGLDPLGRDEILSQIENYHKNEKSTIMLVSHNMEDIARFAKKVLVIKNSHIAMFDETKKVFSRSQELIKMGLDVPQITGIFTALKKQGYDVDTSVYSPTEAQKEILRYMKRND